MTTELNMDSPYTDDILKARTLYFHWLLTLVNAEPSYAGGVTTDICAILHDTEFYSPIENDHNRVEDALDLRHDWLEMVNQADYVCPLDSLDMPVSIFEVLVALARRCEVQLMGDPEVGDRTEIWFWTMIENWLEGNDICIDTIDQKTYDKLIFALQRVMDRKYLPSGYGGFFPLRHPRFDQTQAELWVQLNQYLMENYDF